MSAFNIIKSSQQISDVLSKGKKIQSPLLTLFICKATDRDPQGRVAFIAGKKLGNAVWRNRAKRVLRAAFREAGVSIAGQDVIFMAKKSTPEAGSTAVSIEIARLLKNAQ